MSTVYDTYDRRLGSLRLSVTDRCNLRCTYCMPEESYQWLKRTMLLSFEELTRVVCMFVHLGVDRVRLTGGEPLLRRDLAKLVVSLKDLGLKDISLTTNGLLLERYQAELFAAGLDRVTVSLDALDAHTFERMSQRRDLSSVLAGLHAVAGRPGLKIDTVLLAGVNDDQILPLLRFAQTIGAELRFIEYMDVGGATHWSREQVVTQEQILAVVEKAYGSVCALDGRGSAPAQRFKAGGGGPIFGVVASVTHPFCRSCDRIRLTADGQLLTCLYQKRGFDLRRRLRLGATDEEIEAELAKIWRLRDDRGAELRAALRKRGPLADVEELQENQHLEMHTRGG